MQVSAAKQAPLELESFKIYLYFLDKHPIVIDFLNQIRNTPELVKLYEQIQKDTSSSETASPMDIS